MISVQISDMRSRHLDILTLLQAECLPDDEPYPFKSGDVWYIAWDNKEPVAFGCAAKTDDRTIWYLARAGVMPSHRGRGLQKQLIKARLRAVRRRGARWVITDCVDDNHASARSLAACGFERYIPVLPWALSNSIYWRRPAK